jgi:hypothetical protein
MIAARLLAVAVLAMLAACGQRQNDPGPGAVTMGEARALDEAAEMLEERRLSKEDLRDVPAVDSAASQNEDAAGAQGDAGQ